MKKIRIYVLCYNEITKQSALREYGDKEWAKVLYIETTALLENIMYDKLLLENYEDWKDFDYVGTISWKASHKIILPDMVSLSEHLDSIPYDIISFYTLQQNLVEHGTYYHPKFKSLWLKMFRNMDISDEQALDPSIPAFFCNYWITTPTLMLKYIEFFKKSKDILDNSADIQEEIYEDSTYNGGTLSNEKCIELFGKPYFTYHVFLYERLPCFFFWYMNAKLLNPYTLPFLFALS